MGKVVERFSHAIASLSHSEKHVLYYIEGNLEAAKHQSLTEMAQSVNVSTTTIVRMCQKLGLEGFSELKFLLRTIEQDNIPTDEDIISRHQHDIQSTLMNIQKENIARICGFMKQSNKVIIVAVGLSKMMGEYFSKLLMQVNKSTLYVYESHIIDLLSNKIDHDDFVIFISSSGETKTIVKVAEKLKYNNLRTAALTNSPDSTLAKLATVSLSATVQPAQFAGYDLTARSPLVMLIDILFESFLISYLPLK